MTAFVLVGCAVTLVWTVRVLIAAGREQAALYRAERSVSPDEEAANAARLRQHLAAIDDLRWLAS